MYRFGEDMKSMAYLKAALLLLLVATFLPACENEPDEQGAQVSAIHWLSGAELVQKGWVIDNDQKLADVVPPQPTFTYNGKSVNVVQENGDVNWTAFALILHIKDDGSVEILTQKRAARMRNPLLIESQGGHLKLNQSWREGAAQEIFEEAGITVPQQKLILQNDGQGIKLELSKKGNAVGNAIFVAAFTGKKPGTKLSGENDPAYGHQWVAFKEILSHADKYNKTPQSALYYGTLLSQVYKLANPKSKVHMPLLAANKAPATKERNVAFYLVPNKNARDQLEAISPANPEFKKWGGPHVTVGGFANASDAEIALIAKQLGMLDKNWAFTNIADITMKKSGTFALAHFNSSLLDQAQQILKNEQWSNIKSNWHLTFGKVSATQENAMAAALIHEKWEWKVCIRAKDGSVVWKSLKSFTKK